jgi:hypothetical protein
MALGIYQFILKSTSLKSDLQGSNLICVLTILDGTIAHYPLKTTQSRNLELAARVGHNCNHLFELNN